MSDSLADGQYLLHLGIGALIWRCESQLSRCLSADMTVHNPETSYSPGRFRERFRIPRGPDGNESLYLCGNSLGLQPVAAADAVAAELERWGGLGVAGHFDGPLAWMPYHRLATDNLALITGAKPSEVVAMNSLTVNLHLMMVSFFRPRWCAAAGFLSRKAHFLLTVMRSSLSWCFTVWTSTGTWWNWLHVATVCCTKRISRTTLNATANRLPWCSGQAFSMRPDRFSTFERIARACRRAGVPLAWTWPTRSAIFRWPCTISAVTFAVWCSYKYLNAGPGAVAGCFVHERHAEADLPRLAGWWGHDEKTRFRMGPDFKPMHGAEGWQLSNPPVLALAALWASLELFAEAGMDALRRASLEMTGHLAQRLAENVD